MHTPKASCPSAAAQGPALRVPQTAFSSCRNPPVSPSPAAWTQSSPPGDLSPPQGHSEWGSGKFNGEKKSQRRKGEHRALSTAPFRKGEHRALSTAPSTGTLALALPSLQQAWCLNPRLTSPLVPSPAPRLTHNTPAPPSTPSSCSF